MSCELVIVRHGERLDEMPGNTFYADEPHRWFDPPLTGILSIDSEQGPVHSSPYDRLFSNRSRRDPCQCHGPQTIDRASGRGSCRVQFYLDLALVANSPDSSKHSCNPRDASEGCSWALRVCCGCAQPRPGHQRRQSCAQKVCAIQPPPLIPMSHIRHAPGSACTPASTWSQRGLSVQGIQASMDRVHHPATERLICNACRSGLPFYTRQELKDRCPIATWSSEQPEWIAPFEETGSRPSHALALMTPPAMLTTPCLPVIRLCEEAVAAGHRRALVVSHREGIRDLAGRHQRLSTPYCCVSRFTYEVSLGRPSLTLRDSRELVKWVH